MKQRVIVAVASVLLAALILLLLPVPGELQLPTLPPETTTPTAVPTPTAPKPGVVRLYICNQQQLEVFTTLAAEYTALTGTEVTILTPSKEGCRSTLRALMETDAPPTVLCLHTQADLVAWQDSLLDLSNTALESTLCSDDLGFRVDGKLLALPMNLKAMGLLYNAELMSIALTRNDVMDMGMTTAVQILKSNGLKPFATAELSNVMGLYLLRNTDAATAKAFFDLYFANRVGAGAGLDQFLDEKAVFYFGTTDVYDQLSQQPDRALAIRNLDILPTGTAGGMHYICSAAWGVNAGARPADMQVTLAFLHWLVTAKENAAAPVDQLQTLLPFADSAFYGNQLEKKLRGYMKNESATLLWAGLEQGEQAQLIALCTYLLDPTEENWAAVAELLP